MSWALYVYFLFSHHNNSKSLLNILYTTTFMRKTSLQGLNNSPNASIGSVRIAPQNSLFPKAQSFHDHNGS